MRLYRVGGQILMHKELFDRETFILHLKHAQNEVKSKHPDRLKRLFDKDAEIAVPEHLFLTALCELYGYEATDFECTFKPSFSNVHEERASGSVFAMDDVKRHMVYTNEKMKIKEQTYEEFLEEKRIENEKGGGYDILAEFDAFLQEIDDNESV